MACSSCVSDTPKNAIGGGWRRALWIALIVNALMHTDGPAIVTLRVLTGPERRLRVEVEDRSSALPRRREAGDSGVSGRGLMLVDRLADVWGVEPRGGGKCVWCEFAMT